MVNLAYLHVLLAEMSRLSQLTGNCGRVVTRFFERYFPCDTFSLQCELPYDAHLQALFLTHLHAGLASAASLLQEADISIRIQREALVPGVFHTVVRITLADSLPLSVRERCRLLGQLTAALSLVCSATERTEAQLLREWSQRTEGLDSADALSMVSEHLGHLDEVLRGEDHNLPELPFALIWLIEDLLPDMRGQLFVRLVATS